jgi:pyruvate formate lyase activating enzyme
MDTVGFIADIQRYSLHDGPGIRTVVFLKGCPLECQWCANPETQSLNVELTLTSNTCIGCSACLQACPSEAITIVSPDLRSYRPQIDWERCDQCLECVEECVTGSLKRVGYVCCPSEILDSIMLDQAFFARSGGGVTLSGGEPALQPLFSEAILAGSKTLGINTAIETCGGSTWEALETLLPYCDLVYFDIKHLDPHRHKAYTGSSNGHILRNFERTIASQADVVVRLPLIPGFNDSNDHMIRFATYLKAINPELECELIPYHRLGISKYKNLGRDCLLEDLPAVEPAYLVNRSDFLISQGLNIRKQEYKSKLGPNHIDGERQDQ